MDERSSLLDNQQQQNPDLLSPNLRPRHPNLIPTPCGPIKSWSELSVLVRLYFCFTLASLLALLGVTSSSIYKQHMNTDVSDEDNFTVSLIQLIGIWFCIYYISRGVLQENRQELVAFVLSVLGVMIRSVVNFSVVGSKGKQELLARFVCIVCLGVVHVFCTTLLIWRPNMMAFRVSGALESLQEQYFLLNLCFSMVTFDLQTQVHFILLLSQKAKKEQAEGFEKLCLCVLFTTSDSFMLADKTVILAVGVVGVIWALLTAAVGAVAVLKEATVLVWIFMVQNLPQVAFFVYLMYTKQLKLLFRCSLKTVINLQLSTRRLTARKNAQDWFHLHKPLQNTFAHAWSVRVLQFLMFLRATLQLVDVVSTTALGDESFGAGRLMYRGHTCQKRDLTKPHVVENWFQNKTYTLEAAAVTGALFSLVIKAVLLWGLVRLVHSFGQGLRERMFASRP
uniref:DUF7789 domain-containing protein n=1 Tax=Nothobranchius kuhntae TaxID=321403 RepID=A0A1A8K3U7_NOTKU